MAHTPGDAAQPWQPDSFVERIGAALVAPRRALAAAEAQRALRKTATDLALLIILGFVAVKARHLFAMGWLGISDSLTIALSSFVNTLSRSLATDLAFLLIASIALTVLAGSQRSLAREFDLACVALVPFVTVELSMSLVMWLVPTLSPVIMANVAGLLGYGWAGVVLFLAWRTARARQPRAESET